MLFKVFGKNPQAERLKRFEASPNFKNGVFHNVNPTPMSKEGGSTLKTAFEFLTAKKPVDLRPAKKLPGFKIDLHRLVADKAPLLVWFGHSSYLIKYQNYTLLVDPVFSGHSAPISTAVRAFDGADLYTVDDLPPIDVLILTHDHYDHIDYETVVKLKDKCKKVICPLGVGEHLELWDYPPEKFTELAWWQEQVFSENEKLTVKLTLTPARHFSGRWLERNHTLWTSYVLTLNKFRIFIGGDSGYDDQFKKIGEKFGPFDLALLECGQYGINWPYIHMFPEQTAQAARDLNAKMLMPVHWAKFVLSNHPWTEPIERLLVKTQELGQNVTTPLIGEVVDFAKDFPSTKWWRNL